MEKLKLTPQQHAFFETFGYLGFPGLLADRIDRIIAEFEGIWERSGGGHHGKPHEGKARSCIVQFIDHSAYLSSLLDDPRIDGILSSLLGVDYNYMGSDGNYYVGDTGWHSDGWHKDMRHVKIAFYLDPVGRDSGCLRVIPGSHVDGDKYAGSLQKLIGRSPENFGVAQRDLPCMPLKTKPGDIVLFNHNTKHSAFGGSARRRMFTINCCQRYAKEREQELQSYISGYARFWVERAYGPVMTETATPQRRVHLEQVLANDGHLKDLSRKARETMAEPSRG